MNPAQLRAMQTFHQQVQAGGIPQEIADLPDALLMATLEQFGQPAWSTREVKTNPLARLFAVRFWCDVQDANEGDATARQRVDYCRASWEALRREELIADDPRRQFTELVDPKELL